MGLGINQAGLPVEQVPRVVRCTYLCEVQISICAPLSYMGVFTTNTCQAGGGGGRGRVGDDLLVCETAKDSLKKQEFFFKFQKPFHLSFAEKNE